MDPEWIRQSLNMVNSMMVQMETHRTIDPFFSNSLVYEALTRAQAALRELEKAQGRFDGILRELGSDTLPSVWVRNAIEIAKEGWRS